MFANFPREGYTVHNQVRLIRGGSEYFNSLLAMLHNARQTIHMQMYIFNEDETGQEVLAALMAAASRGVAVFFAGWLCFTKFPIKSWMKLRLQGYISDGSSRCCDHAIIILAAACTTK